MKKPPRVLIVDDNKLVRRMIRMALSAFECAFYEAEDGTAALALIRENVFDVVFLDIRLPYGVSGIEVYRMAKNEIREDIGKVIVFTGWPEDRTRLEATKLGVFAYLEKDSLDRIRLFNEFKKALTPTK